MGFKLMGLIPTVKGWNHRTIQSLWDAHTLGAPRGTSVAWACLENMPLDLVRNELMTVFLSTTAEIAICQDDDVAVEPEWYHRMADVIAAGARIVSAPCRMRSEGNMVNVVPAEPFAVMELGGARVFECKWTGFGCVMVHREVFETMLQRAIEADEKPVCATCGCKELRTYRSTVMPDRLSCALFKSDVVPARVLFPELDANHNEYLLDDRVFSMRTRSAGFKIHAAIDVPTWHRGLSITLGEEMERFDRAAIKSRQRKIITP